MSDDGWQIHTGQWAIARRDSWHVELDLEYQRQVFTNRKARELAWALLAAAEQGDGQ